MREDLVSDRRVFHESKLLSVVETAHDRVKWDSTELLVSNSHLFKATVELVVVEDQAKVRFVVVEVVHQIFLGRPWQTRIIIRKRLFLIFTLGHEVLVSKPVQNGVSENDQHQHRSCIHQWGRNVVITERKAVINEVARLHLLLDTGLVYSDIVEHLLVSQHPEGIAHKEDR